MARSDCIVAFPRGLSDTRAPPLACRASKNPEMASDDVAAVIPRTTIIEIDGTPHDLVDPEYIGYLAKPSGGTCDWRLSAGNWPAGDPVETFDR
jgi:hypothetical protein